VTKGWDHDPPAKEKRVPFGILMVATGALLLLFGWHATSDAWMPCRCGGGRCGAATGGSSGW
jgi:hypothetical protein